MNLAPLVIFILGLLVGFLLAYYVLLTPDQQPQSQMDFTELLQSEIAYQQVQNRLRELQLQQHRQDAEYRHLEQERFKALGQAGRPDYVLLTSAVRAELERLGAGR